MHRFGHGSKSRTASEHPNLHLNRLKWVVHLPQLVTIGFDPHPFKKARLWSGNVYNMLQPKADEPRLVTSVGVNFARKWVPVSLQKGPPAQKANTPPPTTMYVYIYIHIFVYLFICIHQENHRGGKIGASPKKEKLCSPKFSSLRLWQSEHPTHPPTAASTISSLANCSLAKLCSMRSMVF